VRVFEQLLPIVSASKVVELQMCEWGGCGIMVHSLWLWLWLWLWLQMQRDDASAWIYIQIRIGVDVLNTTRHNQALQLQGLERECIIIGFGG
jgi:hypothetical protein